MPMTEPKKKRRWWKVLLIITLSLCLVIGICAALSGGLLELGRLAMNKTGVTEKVADKIITDKIESGELPRRIPLPEEALEKLKELEPSPTAEATEAPQEQPAQSSGVDYSQGIDLSYASAIASVASGADIATAYSVVLGCLSAADKSQIKAYLSSGQEGAAYNLVASRLTGDAYATLAGLYYKYLPMVQ